MIPRNRCKRETAEIEARVAAKTAEKESGTSREARDESETSTPRSHIGDSGEAVSPSEKSVGLAAPLGEVGFSMDGSQTQTHAHRIQRTCHIDPALRRSSSPRLKRG